MTYQFRLTPDAEDDLECARSWYESEQTGLGAQFIDAMQLVFERIEWNPKLYAAGYRGVRASKHERFPYVVRYTLRRDRIEVFAVTHEKRRSAAWTSRL